MPLALLHDIRPVGLPPKHIPNGGNRFRFNITNNFSPSNTRIIAIEHFPFFDSILWMGRQKDKRSRKLRIENAAQLVTPDVTLSQNPPSPLNTT